LSFLLAKGDNSLCADLY